MAIALDVPAAGDEVGLRSEEEHARRASQPSALLGVKPAPAFDLVADRVDGHLLDGLIVEPRRLLDCVGKPLVGVGDGALDLGDVVRFRPVVGFSLTASEVEPSSPR